MGTEPVIDEHRLKELADDFGEEDLAEVVEAFLAEATEAVDSLSDLVSSAPSDERVGQFHFLAGAALNLGAARFARLCKELEKANGPFEAAAFAEFRAEYQLVLEYFARDAQDERAAS